MTRLPSLDDCVHCGLCLPACPTYAVDRRESQNPRGRIAGLRALDEGRATLTPGLAAGLEDCLVCRACESACPSGISMEHLMLDHRSRTRESAGRDVRAGVERWLLEECIPHPDRLESGLGLLRAVRRWLPRRLARDVPSMHRLRPATLPPVVEPAEGATMRGRVTILRGCIADRCFSDETRAAAGLLALAGYRVEFGSAGCCGALHRHAGLGERARTLATERARDLLATRPDQVVVDSAGCGAALGEPLDDDPDARALAALVTDTPSLLDGVALPEPVEPVEGPVAFFTPCHQAHGTGTGAATRRLLERVFPDGVVDLPGTEHCCGAAGLYLLRRPSRSREIGERARARWVSAGRPRLATGNPGCLLRWESLAREDVGSAPPVEVAHPVMYAARHWLGTRIG